VADLAVLEFQKAKAAREAAQEAEVERKRAEKEQEVARLRAKQERARDLQADKDALRAKREQERREREWREKEKFQALKKLQTEEEMRLAREWQIKNKEQHLGVEAARERADFERVLKAQLTLAEKERQQQLQTISKRHRFANDLREQIIQHEKQKVKERADFFDEGIQNHQQDKLRRMRLDQIKTDKLNELRLIELFINQNIFLFILVELVYRKNIVPILKEKYMEQFISIQKQKLNLFINILLVCTLSLAFSFIYNLYKERIIH